MKKLLSVVLAIAIAVTLIPYTALNVGAEEAVAVTQPAGTGTSAAAWDGETDTSWYDPTKDEFTIYTAAQLAGLAELVNSGNTFRDKKLVLTADIDLGYKPWTPIGMKKGSFQGEFDGDGYIISNLYIIANNTNYKFGLFGKVGCGGNDAVRHGGYLHDFTIKNARIEDIKAGTGVVAGSVFHDNVLENITVENATLSGSVPGSAIVGGVQSSQFKNIVAKNITITATNGGQIGGMFGTIQGAMGDSRVKHHASGYCLPGTILLPDDNREPENYAVLIDYFEDCYGENITINIKNANSYIGGFASYCLDYAKDTAIFQNCDIKGLEINIESVNGTPYVGGFIGLRSGVVNYTYTNTEGKLLTVGAFEGCSVQGTINGLTGYYGGFAGESRVFQGLSKKSVTYQNAMTNVDIVASATAIAGGFIGKLDTDIGSIPQTFINCTARGTIKLGDNDAIGSNLIASAKTNQTAGITVENCWVSGFNDIDVLWEKAKENDPTLDESDWKQSYMQKLIVGNTPANISIAQATITFETDGGTAIAPITQNLGTAIIKPADPTKEGYIFVRWDVVIPSIMPAANMTINAIWQIDSYTIKFDTDGGTAIDSITGNYGAAVTAPKAPTKPGYTFDGWDKEIPATIPGENMTIKALWKVNQYTITFVTEDGTVIKSITQDYGTSITAPTPTKTGYTFIGWDKDVPATMPAEDITVKAQWAKGNYSITFDVDGGTAIAPITGDYGDAVIAPKAPTKTGYTFIGWDKEIPATIPGENMTIKALWKVNQYTITFVTEDGTLIKSITQDYGTPITAPTPTKTGYAFGGWDKALPATMPAKDMTLTATWTASEYNVSDGISALQNGNLISFAEKLAADYRGGGIMLPMNLFDFSLCKIHFRNNVEDGLLEASLLVPVAIPGSDDFYLKLLFVCESDEINIINSDEPTVIKVKLMIVR